MLGQDVVADDAQFGDAVGDEGRDIVVAHAQQVDRLVFDAVQQFVGALHDAQAGAGDQLQRTVGEAAGFLHGDTETGFGHGI